MHTVDEAGRVIFDHGIEIGDDMAQDMPDDFKVLGDLTIANCSELRFLRWKIEVTGSVCIKRCHKLVSIPSSLKVGNSFVAHNCDKLVRIFKNFTVPGDLSVFQCKAFRRIGNNLTVGNDLVLLASVKALPANLKLGGSLVMNSVWALEAWPLDLVTIPGDLVLSNMDRVYTFPSLLRDGIPHGPDCITVHGRLHINGAPWLEAISVKVVGRTELLSCYRLQRWGTESHFLGALHVKNAERLSGWPRQDVFHGDVILENLIISDMPPHIHVRGDLSMTNCDKMESIPKGLRVEGNLTVSICNSLMRISTDLQVTGDVTLKHLAALERFTQDGPMRVDKSLNIYKCDSLSTMPASLVVGEDLDIRDSLCCNTLSIGDSVGRDVTLTSTHFSQFVAGDIRGALTIRNLFALDSVYVRHVHGDLTLSGTPGTRTALNSDFQASAGVTLINVQFADDNPCFRDDFGATRISLKYSAVGLAENMQLESLFVSECEDFVFPERLSVRDSITVERLSNFVEFPDGYEAAQSVSVTMCSAFKGLSERFATIERNLALNSCAALRTLPDNLHVGKVLHIVECPRLCALPDNLYVGRSVTVSGSMLLTEWPNNVLRVNGTLDLQNNRRLARLPENLSVRNNLVLNDCPRLTALPDNLRVGNDLMIDNCTRLTCLPEAIFSWGPCANGRRDTRGRHSILCANTGLSQETLEWLRDETFDYLSFDVSANPWGAEPEEPAPTRSLESMAGVWEKHAGNEKEGRLWSALSALPSPDQIVIARFLRKLESAKEFALKGNRQGLAQRVLAALALLEDPRTRQQVLTRIADSVDACSDKPIWALNQIRLVALIAEARGDRAKLRTLGERVRRLGVVHKHVAAKIETLNFVDDVCVYLRFEIALREPLDLPTDAEDMVFFSYIKVTDEEIEAAKREALETTGELDNWLSSWDEWQRQDRLETARSTKWARIARTVAPGNDLPDTDILGNPMREPVRLNGVICNLPVLLRHWTETGMDLYNAKVTPEELTRGLQRVTAKRTRRT